MKEILSSTAAFVLCVLLAACGRDSATSSDTQPEGENDALSQFVAESGKSPVFASLAETGTEENGSSMDAAEACLAPDKWRSLHRRHRYQAVVLTGPIWTYEPLLRHLLKSPDWQLTRVHDTGFVFFPASEGEKKFIPEEPDALFQNSQDSSARARRLAALAENLALADLEAYRKILEQARQLAPDDPVVLAHAAAIEIRAKDWPAAEKSARLALEHNARFSTARHLLIQALLGCGQTDDAYEQSRRLVASEPDDIPTLFLHARVAHAARAFQDEAATLEKLVTLCLRRGVPEGGYRVYLGQAYAKLGDASRALEQFEIALQSPLIDSPSKARIQETVEMIRSRQPAR